MIRSHRRQAVRGFVLGSATCKEEEWVEVLLPDRPNGSTGWIPRNLVVLSHGPYWVEVSTGRRVVIVYRGGHRVRRFRAVVGKPSTPTPHGLAAIYESARRCGSAGSRPGAVVVSVTIDDFEESELGEVVAQARA